MRKFQSLIACLGVLSLVGASPPGEVDTSEPVPQCDYFISDSGLPCPKGRHCYYSICGPVSSLSQRTCESPEAREIGPICDLVRCDCDEPKVYDQSTDSCVEVSECPPQEHHHHEEENEEEIVPYCRSGIGTFKIPCPKGRHCFSSSCGAGPTWSQRTCAEPVARDMGPLCDMIRCDCDEPKVYDESTDSCVDVHDCPQIDPPEEEEVHYCRGFRNVKIPCPKGMHCYSSSCGGKQTLSKRTCREPEEREIGHICDMVRCDCDKPLVYDEVTKTCVEVSACSPNQPGGEDETP